MKSKYNAYNFDDKYEFATYKYVGCDYSATKLVNKSLLSKLKGLLRHIKNRKGKLYKVCDNYVEWENHIIDILPKEKKNLKNMLHWLYGKKNYQQSKIKSIEIILIPLYICLLSLFGSLIFSSLQMADNGLSLIGMLIIIECISLVTLLSSMRKLIYYDDLIKILEDKMQQITSHQ